MTFELVTITYKNWRGETSTRTIEPIEIYFRATEYHAEPQWILSAWDEGKKAMREFAVKDISKWEK